MVPENYKVSRFQFKVRKVMIVTCVLMLIAANTRLQLHSVNLFIQMPLIGSCLYLGDSGLKCTKSTVLCF